jgi:hypothetical protein
VSTGALAVLDDAAPCIAALAMIPMLIAALIVGRNLRLRPWKHVQLAV